MKQEYDKEKLRQGVKHVRICRELTETYERKNKDYGNSFSDTFRKWGIVSAAIRMSDKMRRVESLVLNGKAEVSDESLRDTLMDLANYAIMTVIEMDENKKGV